MSAPPPALPASLSTSGFEDGLGRRSLAFDRESGSVLERLVVRPELAAFERALRERADRLAVFDDERVARVREIHRDRLTGALTVVSEFVAGHRLSDLLDEVNERGRDENTAPTVDLALGFLLQILPTLSALHATTGGTHGAVGDGRTVITPAGQLVLLDAIYGPSLERLRYTRRRLWTELRIAVPPSVGLCRFDVVADLAQAAMVGIAITVGRPLNERDYPDGLQALLDDAVEIAQLRGRPRFAAALQRFFERALPFPNRRAYETADEASAAIEDLVAGEMGAARCKAILTDLARDPVNLPAPVAFDVHAEAPAITIPAADAEMGAATPLEPDPPPPAPEPLAIDAPPIDDVAASVAADSARDADPILMDAISTAPFVTDPEPPVPDPIVADPIVAEPARAELPAAEPLWTESLVDWTPDVPEPPSAQPADADPADAGAAADLEWAAPVAEAPAYPEPAEAPATDPPAAAVSRAQTPEPEPVEATGENTTEAEAAPAPKVSRRKRSRGIRGRRDRLRSAEPPAAPAPVVHVEPPLRMPVIPAPPLPAPGPVRPPEPLWVPPPVVSISPIAAPAVSVAQPTTVVRLKTDAPAGYTPAVQPRTRDIYVADTSRYNRPFVSPPSPQPSNLWWKLATAAAIAIAAGVIVGRGNLMDRLPRAALPALTPTTVAVTRPAAPTGSIAVETEPAGARVLIDGKPAGETPLKVDAVSTGNHIITLITPKTTLKRSVRVDAGQTTSVDVPVYSGWLAIFSPIVLDLAEHGKSIGSTEQGRLMLPPGRHTLTFSNRSLGYSAEQKVDIEAGEEQALTMDPRGTINLNAVPWAEVYIDGERVGETPLANFDIRLGTREILFKHPQLGERRVTTVVTASAPSVVSVDFSRFH